MKWIDAPEGYVMVDLDGRITPAGETISGVVPGFIGCTSFAVHRSADLIG